MARPNHEVVGACAIDAGVGRFFIIAYDQVPSPSVSELPALFLTCTFAPVMIT